MGGSAILLTPLEVLRSLSCDASEPDVMSAARPCKGSSSSSSGRDCDTLLLVLKVVAALVRFPRGSLSNSLSVSISLSISLSMSISLAISLSVSISLLISLLMSVADGPRKII